MTKAKKTFKKLVKTIVIEARKVKNNDVEELIKIEKAFKKAYKVDTTVKYVDVKAKEYITRPTVKGSFNGKRIIVFIDGNLKRNAETLLHELTHVYQAQHMSKQFVKSKKELELGLVSYRDSWHETHARHCARLLVNTFDFKLNLKYAMDYDLAA